MLRNYRLKRTRVTPCITWWCWCFHQKLRCCTSVAGVTTVTGHEHLGWTDLRWWTWPPSTCGTIRRDPRSAWSATHAHMSPPFAGLQPPQPHLQPILTLTASAEEDSRSFRSAIFTSSSSSSSSVLYSSMVSPLEKWMILRGIFSLCC